MIHLKALLPIGCILLLVACNSRVKTVEEVDESGFKSVYTLDKETEQKSGPMRLYDDQGKLVEEANYKNDQLDGLRVLYNEAGDTANVETYLNGKFEGPYRSYHEGGKQIKISGNYVNNAMSGKWYKFYSGGQKKEVVTFADNQENGPFQEWFEDGTLAAEGSYKSGDNEHGRLRIYNEDGTLNRVMDCIEGRCESIWRDTFQTPPPTRLLPKFE